jgi:uncharacterized membrane protein (DUF485 family)
MNKKLLNDSGEIYTYLKVIADNKLEIFKLDAAQSMSGIISKLILLTCLTFLGLILFGLMLLTIGVFISHLSGSIYIGILGVAIPMIIGTIVLYSWRKSIIYKPISAIIYKQILEDE